MTQIGCGLAKEKMKSVTEKVAIIRKRIGYFGFTFMPKRDPATYPKASAVKTIDHDFAPWKYLSEINGPNTFSAAAQHKTMNPKPATIATIHR